jgi:hypothetical protein
MQHPAPLTLTSRINVHAGRLSKAKESELEAVHLRFADAEKGLTRSKAEPGRHITRPDC